MLPALVIVALVPMLTVDVPVVNEHRKFAFVEAPAPVCVNADDAPVTVTEIDPVAAGMFTFAVAAVMMLPLPTVTVAVGTPLK